MNDNANFSIPGHEVGTSVSGQSGVFHGGVATVHEINHNVSATTSATTYRPLESQKGDNTFTAGLRFNL